MKSPWVLTKNYGESCKFDEILCGDKDAACQATTVTFAGKDSYAGMCVKKADCTKAKKTNDMGADFGGRKGYLAAGDGCLDAKSAKTFGLCKGCAAVTPPKKDAGGSKAPSKAKTGGFCAAGDGCESAKDSCVAASADGGKNTKNLCFPTD